MTVSGQKIIIIGAGIGGLAAALSLRRSGAEVTVLEQAEAITEVGAGLQISPNGAAVLRALGLEQRLAEAAPRARAVVLRDYRRAGEVVRLDLARLAPDQCYYLVHRADLIDLLAHAVRSAGVQVRLLQQVTSVQDGPRPRVHLANGATKEADLVIGADGLHSPSRAVLNGNETARFTGQVAWRATVPVPEDTPHEAQVFMGPGQHLVAYPLRDGRLMNLVAVQERRDWVAEGWNHRDDPEALRSAFGAFRGPAQDLLERVETVWLWGLFRHPVAQNWHGERLALLGDAAHPTLPFLAQGANMALEDAWTLARCLEQSAGTPQALAQYQSLRHARVERVIGAANSNAWKYHLRAPFRAPAHLVLNLAGRFAPSRMVHQFDWLYGYDVTA